MDMYNSPWYITMRATSKITELLDTKDFEIQMISITLRKRSKLIHNLY